MRPSPPVAALAFIGLAIGPAGFAVSAADEVRQPVAEYRLAASLDPAARMVTGSGRIRWRNESATPATELRFLTPWNSRRDDRSTWARERAALGQPASSSGSMQWSALALILADGPDAVLDRAHPIAPDDGNPADATVWSVPLDAPVAPGQQIEIEIGWTARVPDLEDGYGAYGSFHLIGGWLPRLGILANDGWHAHQTHAGLPVSASYDRFIIDLRVPDGWIVGATGREIAAERTGDGWLVRRFDALANDFAWTADRRFVERIETVSDGTGPPIAIRVLAQREHASQIDRHLAGAKAAVAASRRWLAQAGGSDALTIVDVPNTNWRDPGRQGGGLVASYPGLVGVRTPWVTPWTGHEPERAVILGVGAQDWQSRSGVASDEDSWLSIGLADVVAGRVIEETFPGRFVQVERYFHGLVAWPYEGVPSRSAGSQREAAARTAASPGWQQSLSDRATNLHRRMPLVFETFVRSFGWDTLQHALGDYARRSASKRPSAREFVGILNSAAGRDLSWFFERTVHATSPFDYAVDTVASTGVSEGYESTFVVRRLADGVLPVEIRVTFSDGSSVVERWDGEAAARAFEYRRPAAITSVTIDPDRLIALDGNRLNNSWTSRPAAGRAALRWSARWAAWFQHLLVTYAVFA